MSTIVPKRRSHSVRLMRKDEEFTRSLHSPLRLESPARKYLQPLQTMAERVGKDVEQFAEMLDQWNTKTRGLEPPALYDNTLELVSQFHSHATKKVKELEVREAAANRGDRARDIQRRIQRMADTPQRSLGLDNDEESVVSFSDKGTTPKLQELRHWQNEVATWNLFRTIIDLYHPKPGFNAATDKKQRLLDLEKKYAERPDQEIWNKFLLEDTVAMEKFKILKWLEKSADSNESDVPSIVAQLEAESGKSMSTWTSGWLDTKHMIKAEKRLRQTGRPLRPDETSIRSADATKELVVQLDPDASSRQRRHLVKSDDYYERAMWMTCYEMLRRGKSWESILEWCREHNESWRGVSMGLTSGGKGDAPTCLTGPYLGSLFRRTCYALAQGSDFRYECAVFGLLSGDLPSVEGVCRTWDDHLYARYNALLLSRFDSYLQAKHADKIPPTLNRNFPTFDAVSFHGDWSTSNRRVVELLKDQNHIKSQAKSPFKLIQGHLIARTFDELVFNVGNMLITREFDEALTLPPGLQPPKLDTPDDYYDGLFQDHNQLRILVHILIVFRTLGMTVGRGHELQETLTDNVIVRFMTLLRQARRFKVIPTYAAQLCATRQTSALASVLPYVGSNAREQKDMCNLIEQANINLMEVVFLGYFSAVHHSGLIEHEDYIKRYNMLETPVSDAYLWPGQRTKGNFLDLNTLPADLAVIESLEWFLHVKKNMGEMLMCLSDAMKMFVLHGRLGAALELYKRLSVPYISISKTQPYFGSSLNFLELDGDAEQAAFARIAWPPTMAKLADKDSDLTFGGYVRDQFTRWGKDARVYIELGQLVNAIHALSLWREHEDVCLRAKEEGKKVPTKRIKESFEKIADAMEPLLNGFLARSDDDEESAQITTILSAYLPDLILAYNSTIQASAHFVSHNLATKSMDLAVAIADDANAHLADAFVRTGRMQELVQALAATSQAMIRLGEGAPKAERRRRGWLGESSRIWDLNVRN